MALIDMWPDTNWELLELSEELEVVFVISILYDGWIDGRMNGAANPTRACEGRVKRAATGVSCVWVMS